MRECPTVRVTVPNAPPVVSVPVQVPPVIKLAGGVRGPAGADGADGQDGAPGVGVPAGGTTRQALVKNSDADYDTSFETLRELPTTPTSDLSGVGAEFVLTTNNGTPPAWEARGQVPVPSFPASEGAVRHLSWQHNTPGPAWITTAHIPYIGLGAGLPRHTLIVGDGGSYRWVQEDPIPALPDESGQFLGIQDGQLAWLHPIPPAIAGTDPQTLTIPANTPTEVAKNLCPNPTAIAGGAVIGSPNNSAVGSIERGATVPPTANGTTTASRLTRITTGVPTEDFASGFLVAGLNNAHPAYSASFQVRASTNFDLRVGPLGGAYNYTNLAANVWHTVTGSVPNNTHLSLGARRVGGTPPQIGDHLEWTDITTAPTFFTGDTPPTPTTTYQWDGAPHNSPSTKYAIDTTTQWTPITLIPPPPPTGTWTLTTTNGTITWEQTP